jgi:hypothetical protein
MGVLEGVLTLGEQTRLVQKFGRLEMRQVALQRLVGQLGNGLQQRPGNFHTDHRRPLQEPLLLRRQAVDAGRQHRLHRGGHLNGRERCIETVGIRLPHQPPGLHQGADALFQKEGIALSALD